MNEIIAEIIDGNVVTIEKISFGYFTVDYSKKNKVIKGYIQPQRDKHISGKEEDE